MSESLVARLMAAVDQRDLDAVIPLLAPDVRLLITDGRRAQGADAVRQLLEEVLASLRSSTHRIAAEWHVDGVWISEVEATYELHDGLLLNAVPRALVIRESPAGIADLRVYGAHERPLSEHDTGEEWGAWVHGRWIPPV